MAQRRKSGAPKTPEQQRLGSAPSSQIIISAVFLAPTAASPHGSNSKLRVPQVSLLRTCGFPSLPPIAPLNFSGLLLPFILNFKISFG